MKTSNQEWLVTNQLGSFAMGATDRVPRRKYHSLLTIREGKRGEALHAILDTEETLVINGKRLPLATAAKSVEFTQTPQPSWVYDLGSFHLERTVQIHPERDHVRVIYEVKKLKTPLTLEIAPWLLLRPLHHIKRENPFLNGTVCRSEIWFTLEPYPSLPKIYFRVSGAPVEFQEGGYWHKGIYHEVEKERGYEPHEDAFVPGVFKVSLDKSARLVFELSLEPSEFIELTGGRVTARRRSFVDQLEAAAQIYVVRTKTNLHSVITGFPWFEHGVRGTLLSLPGLCLQTGKFEMAAKILADYGDFLLKKRTFPALQMTGFDIPFLYVRTVENLTKASPKEDFSNLAQRCASLFQQMKMGSVANLEIQENGRVFVKRGAWAASWMDAVVDGHPVTPRHGYAVEINALFLQGLHFLVDCAQNGQVELDRSWEMILERGRLTFLKTFLQEGRDFLADCHDGDSPCFELRPNQLFAFASNLNLVPQEKAKNALARIRRDLLTPVGLRTLSPNDPKYCGHYRGTQRERDLSSHQGTVWTWMLGLYMDAWIEVYGLGKARSEIQPILARLEMHMREEACLGQLSELFDGDVPHTPRGAPAHAAAVGEVLRVAKKVLR